jgi:alkylation response protein AidB-like acyl-CoA dehydrogenase
MLVDAEMARSGMYYAAWAAAQSEDELPLAASVAKSFIGEAYRRVAESAVLLHGAIGFTWEHDLQLFLRRARVDEMYGGSPAEHREAVAQLIGQPSEPWRTDANSG